MRKSKVISKKDGRMKLKYRFTDFITFDWEKKSYIKFYRLWTKYRDQSKDPVTFEEFKYIIRSMGEKVKNQLLHDPNGVRFYWFSLTQVLTRTGSNRLEQPEIEVKSFSTKKGALKLDYWGFKPCDTYSKILKSKIKNGDLKHFNLRYNRKKGFNYRLENMLDLFNDFQ